MDIKFFIFNGPLKPQMQMFIQVSQNLGFGTSLASASLGIFATKGNHTHSKPVFLGRKHLETQLQKKWNNKLQSCLTIATLHP